MYSCKFMLLSEIIVYIVRIAYSCYEFQYKAFLILPFFGFFKNISYYYLKETIRKGVTCIRVLDVEKIGKTSTMHLKFFRKIFNCDLKNIMNKRDTINSTLRLLFLYFFVFLIVL